MTWPPPAPPPRLETYNEAMARLGLTRPTVRQLVDLGHVRTVRIGRAVRLRSDDIDRFIESGGVRFD